MKSGNAATSVVQWSIVSSRTPALTTAPIYDETVSLSGCDQLFIMVGIPARKSAAMAAAMATTPFWVANHAAVPANDMAPQA
jgi:hypothetical protein